MAKQVGSVKVVRSLNEKLASVLLDSYGKDDEHENLAQEVTAGQEKKQDDVICLKKKIDEAIQEGVEANVKLIHLDAELNHCREEQEKRKRLEEKLTEMSKRLADLAIENANLSKILVLKEKLVEELCMRTSQTSAEFKALMSRLDSVEKENAFLKYEFYMLEKELEIRNEELEYTRRSADSSHRQQVESMKKITMLESECQRLRLLSRKKLPGPAALPRIRNEIEMPGRKPNLARDLVPRDASLDRYPEIPIKNINFLVEQLRLIEEENRTLRSILSKKNAELQSSRIMYSKTASRLSQAEVQKSTNLPKRSPVPTELYPLAGFDTCSDDGGSSSGSWANALMSELEHFRDAKFNIQSDCKAIEVSDISLMDDFAEMERLAIVSSQATSVDTNCSPSTGKELVPVHNIAGEKSFDWLQQVLNAILKQQRVSKRSLAELLEDIKIALGCINHAHPEAATAAMSKSHELRFQMASVQSNMGEENEILLDKLQKLESERKEMGDKIENLMLQLQESKQSVENLQLELETTKASKGMIEDQMENQKSINEDLDTQLTVAKAKLKEVLQKFTSLEVELEEKSNCCEELEVTCLELQLQLESVARKDSVNYCTAEIAQTQNGSEITAASLKLAECQETILNLGKQLKALATPREVAMFDKVFNLTSSTNTAATSKKPNRRFSLRDRMVAEDGSKEIILQSPTKDVTTLSSNTNVAEEKSDSKLTSGNTSVVSLAIIPSKKQGVGFLSRLLMRRKKGSNKKTQSLGKV